MADNASLTPYDVKLANNSDFSGRDGEFIMQYADSSSTILDLASGTGLIINKIFDKVGHITAVEQFEKFTQFIQNSDNITIIHDNIFNYIPDREYDLITLFAVMHYLNEQEATEIYRKYLPFLKKNSGTLIIKNQFGVKEDVNVSGYSDEQQTEYYAQYRHIDKEIEILRSVGYREVKVTDIYPPECNRWENTHFYAITAQPGAQGEPGEKTP